MNEKLKKEALKLLDKITHKKLFLDPFAYREIVDYIIEDFIDRATLAERKRCAEEIRRLKFTDEMAQTMLPVVIQEFFATAARESALEEAAQVAENIYKNLCSEPYSAKMEAQIDEGDIRCYTCGPESADVKIEIICEGCQRVVYVKEGKSYDF